MCIVVVGRNFWRFGTKLKLLLLFFYSNVTGSFTEVCRKFQSWLNLVQKSCLCQEGLLLRVRQWQFVQKMFELYYIEPYNISLDRPPTPAGKTGSRPFPLDLSFWRATYWYFRTHPPCLWTIRRRTDSLRAVANHAPSIGGIDRHICLLSARFSLVFHHF